MHTLVTGGTGFIGSHLTCRLLSLGHHVTITGCRSEQPIPPGVTLLECGFLGIDLTYLDPVDICFHLAGCNDTQATDRPEMMLANYHGPQWLFQHLHQHLGCRRFIYASSCAVYGQATVPFREDQPLDCRSVYAESKAEFESWASSWGGCCDTCVGLRLANVYGPGEGHKGKRASMVAQILGRESSPVRVWCPGACRDWIHVSDVVDAFLAAGKYAGTSVFNCGSGKAWSFREVCKMAGVIPEWVDCPIGDAYQNHTLCDMRLARKLLGFKATTSLQRGMATLRTASATATPNAAACVSGDHDTPPRSGQPGSGASCVELRG